MNIALCGDDEATIAHVREYLSSLEMRSHETIRVSCFSSDEDLAKNWGMQDYHAIILDIEADGLSGLEIAKFLRNKKRYKGEIIFLTYYPCSGEERESDSYAAQYLTKPLNRLSFERKVIPLLNEATEDSDVMSFKTLNFEKILLPIKDIISVHSQNEHGVRNALEVYTVGAHYTLKGNISKLEETLADRDFFRAHRCNIVNLAHVRKIENEHVHLSDGRSVKMGRSKAKDMRAALTDYRDRSKRGIESSL